MPTKKTSRNHSLHAKIIKDGRGLSPVISTIIISGTLLIILVIASFVSANVLELQIASTEFEQAKTNMMLLDEVIQDVSLRRGSGGYVQFNQRSGGIGITQHTEKIKILGPPQQTVVTNSPSSVPTGTWTTPGNAYQSDNQYASTSTDGAVQRYGNYGFNIPSSVPIIKVEIGYEAYTAQDEKFGITCSWDNGSTWATTEYISPTLPSAPDPNTVVWVDFTSATNWTSNKLSNAYFLTRAKNVKVGSAATVYLDWIPARVTYLPPLSTIYESPNLISLDYRGGSHVSGTDLILRGDNSTVVNMASALSYVRVETGSGIHIKLDYYRVRIIETGILYVGGTPHNFIEITFLRLVRGNTGGSDTVDVKAQNIGVDTSSTIYDGGHITIQVQLGPKTTNCTYTEPKASKTVVMFTEILVQVSTA